MNAPNRRHALHALAGLMGAGLMGLPRIAAAVEELVITTYGGSWEKFWRATLMPAFTAKTKINPKLDIGLGRTYMSTMRAAGVGKSPYGVVMTNEIYASVLRAEGQFQKLDRQLIPNYGDLSDRHRGGRWLGRGRPDLADRHRLPHRPGQDAAEVVEGPLDQP